MTIIKMIRVVVVTTTKPMLLLLMMMRRRVAMKIMVKSVII